jgi:pyruvate dehydrogenase E1 component
MPSLPEGVQGDLLRGLYRLQVFGDLGHGQAPARQVRHVRLLGSGAILREVLKAAKLLHDEHSITSEVFSATSYSELARDAREQQRLDRSSPQPQRRPSHVGRLLAGDAPIVAASDYVRAWPQLIAEYVDAKLVTLGTDGFGRSDTRQRLRRFFEVDAQAVVAAALDALRD